MEFLEEKIDKLIGFPTFFAKKAPLSFRKYGP
jgi:hypothetical protein